ncbi:hypothetical protein LJ739_06750 [Aestuariibacter halophilus]|uniref:Uncharacterized protein n=1 Tax=Fluctibacter halophilus TaxID=226011 RepID=A0ABS8G5V1_9ALTE|nr:hypothetical protein [Aestuariibacter halophilus]MCC2615935.1 hypothetical protein [Aestuariibacter halophilus]
MALSTFDELVKSVIKWSHRGDMDLLIPDFITLAETDMKANPQGKPLILNADEKKSAAVMTVGQKYLAFPVQYSGLTALNITVSGEQFQLGYVTPEQLNPRSGQGVPLVYTVANNQIELDIEPDEAYPVDLYYKTVNTPLSAANQTNYVLSKYPNVYLFGTLMNLFTHTQEVENIQLYSTRFYSAIEAANDAEEDIRFSGVLSLDLGWNP